MSSSILPPAPDQDLDLDADTLQIPLALKSGIQPITTEPCAPPSISEQVAAEIIAVHPSLNLAPTGIPILPGEFESAEPTQVMTTSQIEESLNRD